MTDPVKPTTASARRKVLAIEDDRVVRTVVRRLVEGLGYDALEAGSGEEGLAVFERTAPAIVITDWMLPGIDGPEVCRRIRAASGRGYTSVLVLTSRSDKEDQVEALEAGADDFLVKPVQRAELRARLRTADRILDLEAALSGRVSDLERTLALLDESNEKLRKAEVLAAVGAVSVTIRHEMNNALAGIIGMVDVLGLEPGGLPGGVKSGIAEIGGLARRIRETIKKLERVTEFKTVPYLSGDPDEVMLALDAEPPKPPPEGRRPR